MNQEETNKDTSIKAKAEEKVASEIDFRKIIDPLVDNEEKKPQEPLAVGQNLEKVKTAVIEKVGEVKTTIVEKAVEVRKSIDQLLHTSTPPVTSEQHDEVKENEEVQGDGPKMIMETSANKDLDSSQGKHEHKASMGEKLESVKTAVVHKAESVRTSLVVTAEELQNSLSHMFDHNNNNHHDDDQGQEEENDKTTERGTDEDASLDNKENNNNRIGAACSWIVHKVDDLVERVQAHDKQELRPGETTRRLSRDLVEIISQEDNEEVKGRETTTKQVTFEEKVDQARTVTSDHA